MADSPPEIDHADGLPAAEVELTAADIAAGAGVSVGTVRRWVAEGLVPGFEGKWTESVRAWVRVIARLRERGHSLDSIRDAIEQGRIVSGPIETLLRASPGRHSVSQAARATGLDRRTVRELMSLTSVADRSVETLTDQDIELLSYASTVLEAGFPLSALMQLMRVYSQKIAQIADAEVRLIHLYVHEPMIQAGYSGTEIAAELAGLTNDLLPLAPPVMNFMHARLLANFVELDTISQMESELESGHPDIDRLRVAIAFADLAGYSRLTVERGDDAALEAVERFVGAAEAGLPLDARITKTLGDEVMVVGGDPAALARWAVELQEELEGEQTRPRIGIHSGDAVYRDGDYYGREVNQAARVVARAAGGEVLATRAVRDASPSGDGLRFDRIGEVSLKGFSELTELFRVTATR